MRTLSIIILSYNTEQITHQCLDSLIQNVRASEGIHFEIIVVDNASSDNSPQMLTAFQHKNKLSNLTCKIILNETNEGFPKGNNRGVRACHGEYVLFLNSDVL
ncbi:glycosyltransferase, partial [Candidatus Woesebacteria bacterium]|nr:glycosyltransferase [Candidatus Woesebacteria bacterium]